MGLVAEWMVRTALERDWRVTLVASIVPQDVALECLVRRIPYPRRLPSVPQHLLWCARVALALEGLGGDLVHVHSPVLLRRADLMTCHYLARPASALGLQQGRAGVPGQLRRVQEAANSAIDDRLYRHRGSRACLSFVSEFLASQFRLHYGEPNGGWILPPPAPGWYPPDAGERRAAREHWGVRPGRLVVGYLGGDDPRKGPDRVLALLEEPDLEVLIGGPGSERLHWNGGRGLGFLDADKLLAACDVLVAPSVFDSAPLAVLQGIARGIPVVVTPTLGWADAIARHRSGVVWSDGAPLAEAVRKASAVPAEACRACAEEFSEERLRGRLIEVYEQVAARRAGYPYLASGAGG